MSTLIEQVRQSVIGAGQAIVTPFGEKPLVYADYTASGRSLGFIEDYIRQAVLPWYANTHSEASFTGSQTTLLREQARQEIRQAINGTGEDQVIFCGSGATAAINKLLDVLGLRLPRDLARQYELEARIPDNERPVIFLGPYEHHSNELPWRESIADVVSVPLNERGQICEQTLAVELQKYADRPVKIGSFSAASNVTGIKSDVQSISRLLKRHGALVFWDYAAAAPYLAIDMNGETPLDAVFISPHKFVGGPGSPGVLVAKRAILNNTVPAVVGGGTVMYVTPEDHRYIADHERREEGGTPGIVESIRAGLVFKLQQEVGLCEIQRREHDYIEKALARFRACHNLEVLGNTDVPRLSIISLRFKCRDKDLHYGYIVSLLNDLFGIQVRGGCSCAGPYGHSLLGMDMTYSRALETEIERGAMVMRPGWVRLNFNYFVSEQEFEYLLSAIELVAEHGWRLLPYYHFDTQAGVWRYLGQRVPYHSDLSALRFLDYREADHGLDGQPVSLEGVLDNARQQLLSAAPPATCSSLDLCESAERLRWFVLPQEVASGT